MRSILAIAAAASCAACGDSEVFLSLPEAPAGAKSVVLIHEIDSVIRRQAFDLGATKPLRADSGQLHAFYFAKTLDELGLADGDDIGPIESCEVGRPLQVSRVELDTDPQWALVLPDDYSLELKQSMYPEYPVRCIDCGLPQFEATTIENRILGLEIASDGYWSVRGAAPVPNGGALLAFHNALGSTASRWTLGYFDDREHPGLRSRYRDRRRDRLAA